MAEVATEQVFFFLNIHFFYCHFLPVEAEKVRVSSLPFVLVCFSTHLPPPTLSVLEMTLIRLFEYLLSKQPFICRDLTVGHGRAKSMATGLVTNIN